jgi:hypothetical protein
MVKVGAVCCTQEATFSIGLVTVPILNLGGLALPTLQPSPVHSFSVLKLTIMSPINLYI